MEVTTLSVLQKSLDIYHSLSDDIERRKEQEDMIAYMADRIDNLKNGIMEAPTGTGKTLAVLTVALAAWLEKGYRSVISTNTHLLQSQLVSKDYKLIKESLRNSENLDAFMIKNVSGKSSYVCRKKLDALISLIDTKGPLIAPYNDSVIVVDKLRLLPFSESVRRIEIAGLPEGDPLNGFLSCDAYSCEKDCKYYAFGCPYYQAIRFKSPLLVTNHAMIKSLLQKTGTEKSKLAVLNADLYFFDEAHHLMGYSVEGKVEYSIRRPIEIFASPLPEFYKDIFNKRENFRKRIKELFNSYFLCLENHSLKFIPSVLTEMRRALEDWKRALKKLPDETLVVLKEEFIYAAEVLKTAAKIYNEVLAGREVHITPDACSIIHLDGPRSLTEDLRTVNDNFKSAQFLSSTISVDGNFDAFKAQTGVDCDEGIIISSVLPWDNVIFWVPEDIPAPNEDEDAFVRYFSSFCAKYVPPFAKRDLGGVLVLCSSYKRMHACSNALKTALPSDVALFTQGDMPKRALVKRFLNARSPVLVASESFREGFDAPGKNLTWVIMDRLPFASPEDEEMNRTVRLLQKWDSIKDPFGYSLGMMKLSLRQGIGRLLRSRADYGAVTAFDSRIIKYGDRWNIKSSVPIPESNWITEIISPEEWVSICKSRFPKSF